MAITIFLFFVAVVLGISFFLGAKAKSAQGFFAAGGGVPWFINGIAFAGDYLSAASFLGICGMIASYGYDGFLYSIGFLAGWVVALATVLATVAAFAIWQREEGLTEASPKQGLDPEGRHDHVHRS